MTSCKTILWYQLDPNHMLAETAHPQQWLQWINLIYIVPKKWCSNYLSDSDKHNDFKKQHDKSGSGSTTNSYLKKKTVQHYVNNMKLYITANYPFSNYLNESNLTLLLLENGV